MGEIVKEMVQGFCLLPIKTPNRTIRLLLCDVDELGNSIRKKEDAIWVSKELEDKKCAKTATRMEDAKEVK